MQWVETGSMEVKIRNLRGENITITSAEIHDLQPQHLTPVILCPNRDGPAKIKIRIHLVFAVISSLPSKFINIMDKGYLIKWTMKSTNCWIRVIASSWIRSLPLLVDCDVALAHCRLNLTCSEMLITVSASHALPLFVILGHRKN